MNYAKGHLFARGLAEFSFSALIDRTIREQNREQRQLAEQRATKHQFQARNSCILDGRNYRIARRLLQFPRAQFLTENTPEFSRVIPQPGRSDGIEAQESGRNLQRWQ